MEKNKENEMETTILGLYDLYTGESYGKEMENEMPKP